MNYLLDADVFIDAKNRHYGFDFAPGFWDWLNDAHQVDRVFSVTAIRGELVGGGDLLATWASQCPSTFWVPVETSMLQSLRIVAQWAQGAGYDEGAVSTFLENTGDYYLVAQAHALGYTVVTLELPGQGSTKKVKIPDACRALGVPCINTWQLLRAERARLVSASQPVRQDP